MIPQRRWYWVLALLAMALSRQVFALPMVESVIGDVQAVRGESRLALVRGSALENGTTLVSGAASSAVIRFDDGQVVVLSANSVFKLDAFQFNPDRPQANRSEMELVRGAMRFVSGLLGKQTPEAVRIRTNTATVGIRGTDFMLVTGSLYVSVGEGAVTVSNAAGTQTLTRGFWVLDSINAAPRLVTGGELPDGLLQKFTELRQIPVENVPLPEANTPGYDVSRAAGTLTISQGALGALTITPVGVAAAAAMAIIAVGGSGGGSGTTGTTGTVRP